MFQIGLEFDFSHLQARENRRAVSFIWVAGILFPAALGAGPGMGFASDLFARRADGHLCAFHGRVALHHGDARLGPDHAGARHHPHPPGNPGDHPARRSTMWWAGSCWRSPRRSPRPIWTDGGWRSTWPACSPSWGRPGFSDALSWCPSCAGRPQRDDLSRMGILLGVLFACGLVTQQLGCPRHLRRILAGGAPAHRNRFRGGGGGSASPDSSPPSSCRFSSPFTGLRTDLSGLVSWELWGWCLLVAALAMLGKFGGCWAAGRWAGLSSAAGALRGDHDEHPGAPRTGGGERRLRSEDHSPSPLFTILVCMALFSTSPHHAVPPAAGCLPSLTRPDPQPMRISEVPSIRWRRSTGSRRETFSRST